MAEKVEVEVIAKTDKAVKALNNLENKLEDVSKVGQKNREGFEVLDQATGGYAGKIRDLSGSVKGVITGAKGFIKTLKGVKGALISTGIGALVVALGLIVAYWDDIKGLVDGTTRAQREGLAEAEKLRDVTQQQLDITNSMENTLKAQGKTEKEIRDLKIQQTNEVIAATEAQLAQQQSMKESQIEAAERNRDILSGILKFLSLPIAAVLKAYDYITGSNTSEIFDKAAELLFDPTEVAEEGNAAIEETEAQLRKLKNTRDGYILQEQKEKESQAEKRKAQKQKEDDAEIQAEKDKQAALERIRKGLIDTEAEERAEKLRLIKADYDEQIKLAELYYGEETEKVKELREAQRLALEAQQLTFDEQDEAKLLAKQVKRAEELELDKAFEEASFEEQRAILAERREMLLNDETLTDEQKLELTKQYKAADKKLDDIEFEGKQKMQGEAMDLAGKAQALAGKNTVAGKAIGIATATINTFQGASEAMKQKSTLPSPFDVVAKVANVATVIATGLKTVKSIASVKVPGGGGSGGATPSGGGVAAPAPPSFNVVGATETSVLADTVAEQTNEPVQAYVVSNDVTTAQSLENNIVEGATI
jgi:hypothetical protein